MIFGILAIVVFVGLMWWSDKKFKRDGGDELREFEQKLWRKYIDKNNRSV